MKVLGLMAIFLLALGFSGWAAESTAAAGMEYSEGPVLYQATGAGEAQSQQINYPEFYDASSDNPSCDQYLKDTLSGKRLDTPATCATCGGGSYADQMGNPNYTVVPGLELNVSVPESLRKNAKIIVKWTVRVEGYQPNDGYAIFPRLCSPWHGTSYQRFGEGKVKTALFTGNVKRGDDAVMTIPSAGETAVTQSADPTHSGSYVLEPSAFEGGEFPATLNVKIQWKNETSMLLKSPDGMRSLIVTIVPTK
jgi:hypothetical protein